MSVVNDLSLCVATPNGSGSASSNRVLFQSIFKMGIPCSSKNMFPSNIQGMPTWYQIRASSKGYLCRADEIDCMICFNPETFESDILKPRSGGLLLYDNSKPLNPDYKREDVTWIGFPAEKLVAANIKGSKIRAKLRNMVYVGAVAALFDVDMESISGVLKKIFGSKPEVVETNQICIQLGYDYIKEEGFTQDLAHLEKVPGGNEGLMLMEGNTASAIGAIYGGVSVVSWYPITPSSSLAESLEKYLPKLRRSEENDKHYAVIQAEDEIAAAGMVVGASWVGARSVTCTSGPGLSLMNEMVGLSYFGEIPSNFFIVQRGGPSTGLPTRVQQSDLLSMYTCSHGDTRHPVLIPYDMQSCFDLSRICFDISDYYQTPVFVATDLDLGMNLWSTDPLAYERVNLDRGKIVSEEELKKVGNEFLRFRDEDGDGVGARTLPGNKADGAAYFTSGALQGENGRRSEDPEVYTRTLDRLRQKLESIRERLPEPIIEEVDGADIGIISFGSSVGAVLEARDRLKAKGYQTSNLVLQALPLHKKVREFIENHKLTFLVEQNRDGQVNMILKDDWGDLANKVHPVLIYDGLPLTAGGLVQKMVPTLQGGAK